MLTAKKIMPVVLVSIAAILALAFMLTHFAEQMTAQAAFELNPMLQRYQGQMPSSISTKETCIFTNPGLDCESKAVSDFCYDSMGVSVKSAAFPSVCSKASITCELPCGKTGSSCNAGSLNIKFSRKAC